LKGGFVVKKVILLILLLLVLLGCTTSEQYTKDRIILSYDTTQFSNPDDMTGYIDTYGTLPPEFVIVVFDAPVKLAREYASNGKEANMQTSIVLKQRIGDQWSADVVVEKIHSLYTVIEGDIENTYLFFLNNGLAVDMKVEESGNVTFSIGRNLRQIEGLLYAMPYGVTSWEDTFLWYQQTCRNCMPHTINENQFRFSFEGERFLFEREANGVYTVRPYQA
jgi:hypothetical protein